MEFGVLENKNAENTPYSRNPKRRQKSESVQVHIPQEIVDNILTRLALKSLVRFESVCKAWRSSILNSNFQRRDRHSVSSIQRYSKGMVYHSLREHEMPFVEGFPIFWDRSEDRHSSIHVSNSCNGMVLVWVGTSIYLFNPSTHYSVKVLTLNYLDNSHEFDSMCCSLCYKPNISLYYDETISDYKAVVLICHGLLGFGYRSEHISILVEASLKGKRWNHLNHTFKTYDDIKVGPMVNGRLYWLVNEKITRFDSVLKVLEELPTFQPKHSEGFKIVGLGFIEGCLCVSRSIEKTIEILAMKEFGISESWTPIFSFSATIVFRGIHDCKPLLLTRTGELFVSISENLWVYNLSKKTFKEHCVDLKGSSDWSVSFVQNTYTPTGYYWNQTEHEQFGNIEDFEGIYTSYYFMC